MANYEGTEEWEDTEADQPKNFTHTDNVPTSQSWTTRTRIALLLLYSCSIAAVVLIPFILIPNSKSTPNTNEYVPVSGPTFGVNLLNFQSSSILDGYPVCEALQEDLMEAAKYLVNVQIDTNSRRHYRNQDYNGGGYYDYYVGIDEGTMEVAGEEPETMEMDSRSGEPEMTNEKSAQNDGEDSFGTNNQVDGVDEADVIKATETHVFAAFGDTLVVWNATSGVELSRTDLSPLVEKGEEETEHVTIVALLLHEERITVIANIQQYGMLHSSSYVAPILSSGYGQTGTRLFIYDAFKIPTNGSALTLVLTKDLRGGYKAGRSIGPYVHIVTSSQVNTWGHLLKGISIWDNPDLYQGLNETEYREMAYNVSHNFITSFADTLLEELLADGDIDSNGDCTHILKVALALTSNDNDEDTNDSQVQSFASSKSVLSSILEIHSMNMLLEEPSISSSGVFLPTSSYSTNVYSSTEKLVISTAGYEQSNDTGEWMEQTYLIAYHLNNDTSQAVAIGTVPGYLLNQFSMDHYSDPNTQEDYLRVATTTWERWGWDSETRNWVQVEESESAVTIFKFPSTTSESSSQLEMTGQVQGLGTSERIYSCRFLGPRAYVVTFRQTDPFYTLDLSDPTNPLLKGELHIPGFSNYLHPIRDDGSMVLAVGQDANKEGQTLGLQISMFNVTDLENPTRLHKYVEAVDTDNDTVGWGGHSTSEAQYDHKAFRYLSKSQLLILPASIYIYGDYENSFDGFVVYNVDEETGISVRFKISHGKPTNMWYGCWDTPYMSARSLVFDGDVTTIKGRTVLSHNLETQDERWTLDLDQCVYTESPYYDIQVSPEVIGNI